MILLLVLAQAAVAAVSQQAGAEGVISYPAAFFAAQQPSNASEMVVRLPGFTLDQGDSVRGFEGAAGNVLIDGRRPTSKTDNLDEILRRLPASQVERIDVIRGGAPGIDMQGKSVLANVIKKPGGGFRGLGVVANYHTENGRNVPTVRLELSGENGDRSWEAAARYQGGVDDGGDDGPQVRLDPKGQVIQRADVTGQSGGINGVLSGAWEQPLLGGRVRINGRLYQEKWKTVQDIRYSQPASLGLQSASDINRTNQTELGLLYNRDLTPKAALEVIGLRQTKDRDEDSRFRAPGEADLFLLSRQGSETIGRAVLKYRFDDRLSGETGGETAVNRQDSQTGYSVNGAAQRLPAANVAIEEKRSEVFLKGTWRPTATWTVDGGIRYEFSTIASSGDVALSKDLRFAKPRVQATWQALPATQLRFRYERTIGQLNFDDFVASTSFGNGQGVSAGNPNLNPEQVWVSEGIVEQRFWGGAVGVLTLRHFAGADVVDRGPVRVAHKDAAGRDVVDFYDQPTNIGDGTKDELVADLSLPSDHFGWKGGLVKAQYTRRRSEVTDPTTHTPRPISNTRPEEWWVNLSQDIPRWGLTAGFNVYSGWERRYYRLDSVEQIKLHNAYLDPFIDKRLTPTLVLRLEVSNLASRGIRDLRRVYAVPRTATNLLYIDDRNLIQGPSVFVRLRQTF